MFYLLGVALEPGEFHTLFECLESAAFVWLSIIFNTAILGTYLLIARRWIQAAKHAPTEKKYAWLSLTLIFLLCGASGYGLPSLAAWFPEIAYRVSIYSKALLLVCSVVFLMVSDGDVLEISYDAKGLTELLAEAKDRIFQQDEELNR
jgi:hypothetical protein